MDLHPVDVNGMADLVFDSGLDSGVVLTVSKPGFIPYQINLSISIILDADDDGDIDGIIPEDFTLHQNYPNPANPVTIIAFDLPSDDQVRLELYNLLGQKIFATQERYLSAGTHQMELDLDQYPSGVYFYRMVTSTQSQTRKLMLLK